MSCITRNRRGQWACQGMILLSCLLAPLLPTEREARKAGRYIESASRKTIEPFFDGEWRRGRGDRAPHRSSEAQVVPVSCQSSSIDLISADMVGSGDLASAGRLWLLGICCVGSSPADGEGSSRLDLPFQMKGICGLSGIFGLRKA